MPSDVEPPIPAVTEKPAARRPRLRLLWLAPLLAVIAMTAWVFASPVGSSPDDDFHLVSIWCADGGEDCAPGQQENTRVVPEPLVDSACYMAEPAESAACQEPFDSGATVETKRGDFAGAYPPIYYGFMSLFAGDDLVASVLLMRFVNVLLFVGLSTALFALLPAVRRPTLLWTWLITTVPLGLFLLSSNNPSAWAIMGVGISWLALLGWYETAGPRRVLLGVLFGITVLMAAGARADAAVYVGVGIAAVVVLTFRPTVSYLVRSILPLAAAVVCLFFFFSARQSSSGISGFGGAVANSPARDVAAAPPGLGDVVSQIVTNLTHLPGLWAGVFGYWGLGWLDTFMPAGVLFAAVGVFVAVTFTGARQLDWRKGIAAAGVLFTLVLVPIYVLAQGGHMVGQQVQPRYVLPLIALFAGIMLLPTSPRPIGFTRAQRIVLGLALVYAVAIALHTNIRRYVTGSDVGGANLNADIEWWWGFGPSPMAWFAIGVLAWAGAVWVLLRELSVGRQLRDFAAGPQPVLVSPGR
ncbi:DUF2142 domain-containing protein [Ruicaihuangia caeni]|uniref:DUF2142 domain-containing protein n=1 Tax=Ruicaihuangia caeni TaxID=3042517 RepID=UPI0033902520